MAKAGGGFLSVGEEVKHAENNKVDREGRRGGLSRHVAHGPGRLCLGRCGKEFFAETYQTVGQGLFRRGAWFLHHEQHFHLLVRMETGLDKSSAEIRKRFKVYYGEDEKRELSEDLIPALREKWGSLSQRHGCQAYTHS